MLHSLTKIQWMDVKTQQVFTDTIGKMFQMYSLKAQRTLDDISQVLFHPESEIVKITDMTGWTDVKAIRRCENITEWTVLGAASHGITVTSNTFIPIYSPSAPFQGFHGETKYPYLAKMISDIIDGDMVRVRRGVDNSGNDVEFADISFAGIIFNKDELTHGYEIETNSGFFNANNIHLLSDDKRSEIKRRTGVIKD